MADLVEVINLEDPALAVYARLTQAQLRNKKEPEMGLFIAESPKVIRTALEAGYQPVSLLMERQKLEGQGKEIMDLCGEVPVYTGDRETLAGLTGYQLTRGILCAMRRPAPRDPREILEKARRVAVLEGMVDTTNLGAVFRSAAALGMDGVLLSPGCCDPLARRAIRVSMGTVFQLPWAVLGESRTDWPEGGLALLKEYGFSTAAMALREDSLTPEDTRLKRAEKLAVILGTEGDGLDPRTIAACDHTVMIPMSHGVDSLNVAAAAAVAFWELGRH